MFDYTLTASDTVDVLARMSTYTRGDKQCERMACRTAESAVGSFLRDGSTRMLDALISVLFEISGVDFTGGKSCPKVAFDADWATVLQNIRTKALEDLAHQRAEHQEWLEDVGEAEYLKSAPHHKVVDGKVTTHPWGDDGPVAEKFLAEVTPYQVWRCLHEAQEAAFTAIREDLFEYILEQASSQYSRSSAERAAAKAFTAECAKLAKVLSV